MKNKPGREISWEEARKIAFGIIEQAEKERQKNTKEMQKDLDVVIVKRKIKQSQSYKNN